MLSCAWNVSCSSIYFSVLFLWISLWTLDFVSLSVSYPPPPNILSDLGITELTGQTNYFAVFENFVLLRGDKYEASDNTHYMWSGTSINQLQRHAKTGIQKDTHENWLCTKGINNLHLRRVNVAFFKPGASGWPCVLISACIHKC